MLASTIDPELNSPRGNEVSRLVVEENSEPVEDIWAGINFNLLYKQLSSGINDQTHPWDPIVENSTILPQNNHENFDNLPHQKNIATGVLNRQSLRDEARGLTGICHIQEKGHIALNLPSCMSKNGDPVSSEDNSDKIAKVMSGNQRTGSLYGIDLL